MVRDASGWSMSMKQCNQNTGVEDGMIFEGGLSGIPERRAEAVLTTSMAGYQNPHRPLIKTDRRHDLPLIGNQGSTKKMSNHRIKVEAFVVKEKQLFQQLAQGAPFDYLITHRSGVGVTQGPHQHIREAGAKAVFH
jgi:carbamoylphosphate synthase small subunit